MVKISTNEFLLWEKKQLLKGGDKQSLYLLLHSFGGVCGEELILSKVRSEGYLSFKEDLDLVESKWEEHLYKFVPIQYLCGYTFWRDLKLTVSKKVLIPRSETEIIVDIVRKKFSKNKEKFIFAELGTGSGAISIALALAFPLWDGTATDIDKNALEVALGNFVNTCNQSNLKFCRGNWWDPLENLKGVLDLVVSNPPYIPENIYRKLPNEVKNFEPKLALLGGEDGLKHIREIIKYAPKYLKEKGWLIIENHFDQGPKVKKLFLENNFTSVEVLKDFSGIGRFTIGRYK